MREIVNGVPAEPEKGKSAMNPLHPIESFIANEALIGDRHASSISLAVSRLESLAYARGLRDGLSRVAKIAAIVSGPTHAGEVIEMAQRELDGAIKAWQARAR